MCKTSFKSIWAALGPWVMVGPGFGFILAQILRLFFSVSIRGSNFIETFLLRRVRRFGLVIACSVKRGLIEARETQVAHDEADKGFFRVSRG